MLSTKFPRVLFAQGKGGELLALTASTAWLQHFSMWILFLAAASMRLILVSGVGDRDHMPVSRSGGSRGGYSGGYSGGGGYGGPPRGGGG